MAKIRPLFGLRFSGSAGDLDDLVAPPYDVISESEREALAAQSENNVVSLTLPLSKPDDRSKYVKYARSASTLEDWVREGILQKETKPAYYRYLQTFALPNGQVVTRQAMIATIKVEPYEAGTVLPHEQTFPKHKEDRLRILEATRSHLECIYGLYEDPDRTIFDTIGSANGETVADISVDDVRHVIETITDEAEVALITKLLSDRKVWIADGHHRYETAVNFRQALGERDHEVPEDYMMMALSSMADPGLVILPTHRILKKPVENIREKLEANYWTISEVPNSDLMNAIEGIQNAGHRAFGIAQPGGTGLVLEITDLAKVVAEIPGDASESLKSLDVTILHDIIFAKHLGLTGIDFFGYTRIEQEAVDAVEAGVQSFLMNAPSVEDMRIVALGGEKMPQKSTYYYPKIISGLVIWRLEDFA
jgi:uncharacterized protein (DUF1015 family)